MKDSEQEEGEYFELPLQDDQFTTNELLSYLRMVYSTKINQMDFSHVNLAEWSRRRCLPEAYGGNKIKTRIMSGISIHKVEGLSREDLRYLRTTVVLSPRVKTRKKPTPRRTRAYYDFTGITPPPVVLPDNWRKMGIRGNQLTRARKY